MLINVLIPVGVIVYVSGRTCMYHEQVHLLNLHCHRNSHTNSLDIGRSTVVQQHDDNVSVPSVCCQMQRCVPHL